MPKWTKDNARWLKQARESRGWTQVKLSELADVTPATISALENREHYSLHQDTLDRLEKILGFLDEGLNQKSDTTHTAKFQIRMSEKSINKIQNLIESCQNKLNPIYDKILDEVIKYLKKMDHVDFERGFLKALLESHGFSNVGITQQTRDLGIDATCTDKDGKKVHVSAKHWNQSIAPDEVRRIRGTGGEKALVVCLSASDNALKESKFGDKHIPCEILSGYDLAFSCIRGGLVKRIGVEVAAFPIVTEDSD